MPSHPAAGQSSRDSDVMIIKEKHPRARRARSTSTTKSKKPMSESDRPSLLGLEPVDMKPPLSVTVIPTTQPGSAFLNPPVSSFSSAAQPHPLLNFQSSTQSQNSGASSFGSCGFNKPALTSGVVPSYKPATSGCKVGCVVPDFSVLHWMDVYALRSILQAMRDANARGVGRNWRFAVHHTCLDYLRKNWSNKDRDSKSSQSQYRMEQLLSTFNAFGDVVEQLGGEWHAICNSNPNRRPQEFERCFYALRKSLYGCARVHEVPPPDADIAIVFLTDMKLERAVSLEYDQMGVRVMNLFEIGHNVAEWINM